MTERKSGLSDNSAERKSTPVFSGVLKYFPDALCEVAALSRVGNDKHNPGEPLHWAKEKSQDEDDCVIRHMLNVAKGEVFDDESYPGKSIRHRAAVAWRALAGLQREIEAERAKEPYAAVAEQVFGAAAINPQPDLPAPLDCAECERRSELCRAECKAGFVICDSCMHKRRIESATLPTCGGCEGLAPLERLKRWRTEVRRLTQIEDPSREQVLQTRHAIEEIKKIECALCVCPKFYGFHRDPCPLSAG